MPPPLSTQAKHEHTTKILLAIIPSGVIVFASKCYPGSITDKEIVVDRGRLNKFVVGNNIMADKGFLIRQLTWGF